MNKSMWVAWDANRCESTHLCTIRNVQFSNLLCSFSSPNLLLQIGKYFMLLSALLSSTVPTLFMHSGTLQGKLIFEEDKQMMNS